MRIVVVEDDESLVEILSAFLSELGHKVVGVADNRDKALALAEYSKPDLVLMDVKLGTSFDGVDAALALRERLGIPSMFVTAYADDKVVSQAEKSMPYGYLVKPFERSELDVALKTAEKMIEVHLKIRAEEDTNRKNAEKLELYRQSVLKANYKFINSKKQKLAAELTRNV